MQISLRSPRLCRWRIATRSPRRRATAYTKYFAPSSTNRLISISSRDSNPPEATDPDKPTHSTSGHARVSSRANPSAIVRALPFNDRWVSTRRRDFSSRLRWVRRNAKPSSTTTSSELLTERSRVGTVTAPPSKSTARACSVGAYPQSCMISRVRFARSAILSSAASVNSDSRSLLRPPDVAVTISIVLMFSRKRSALHEEVRKEQQPMNPFLQRGIPIEDPPPGAEDAQSPGGLRGDAPVRDFHECRGQRSR